MLRLRSRVSSYLVLLGEKWREAAIGCRRHPCSPGGERPWATRSDTAAGEEPPQAAPSGAAVGGDLPEVAETLLAGSQPLPIQSDTTGVEPSQLARSKSTTAAGMCHEPPGPTTLFGQNHPSLRSLEPMVAGHHLN